jgi:hypothetical protein
MNEPDYAVIGMGRDGTREASEGVVRADVGGDKELEDLLDPSAADPEKRRGYESMPKRVWSKLVTSG